ncbi:MAG: glycosyltransferase family 2 protein [Candidatus Aenigmarchaeota archaeon]|nr:glycosyltransferase family 2 protein [Candidatus Aenigmarchaeota archaeon]
MTKQKIIAVIPALNEEKTISKVIKGVKKYVDEIVLVDDASTDKTKTIAQKDGAIVISHSKNMGYDKAIGAGFILASKRGATIILTFDGDGQHNPEDIPKIISPIIDGKADIVTGKRPHYARITEYLFAFIAKIKIGIDDPLCGLKAYHIDIYNDIGYFDKLSSIGTQLMFNAKKKGYKIVQRNIDINEREDNSRFGEKLKANWKIFKAIVKIILWIIIKKK